MPNQIVLIGVSGAGKTAVGEQIAAQSGADFHDFDAYFERLIGEDPSEFLVRRGEQAYEEASLKVAREILGADGVVALSPGSTREEEVAQLLGKLRESGATVVELFADTSTLMRRTGLNAPRSVALGPTRRILADMVASYRADFEGLADLVIDTSLSKPEHVASRILAFTA
ncbi:MAG: shikimate kinase [Actinomycetaceae bacterium]|nr:shikimate kinase [Actinomycetaceae bacterium]